MRRLPLFLLAVLVTVTGAAHGAKLSVSPMLGAGTPTSQTFWLRLDGPGEALVQVGVGEEFFGAIQSQPVQSVAENDFTVTVEVTGLQPGTRYAWQPVVDGEVDRFGVDAAHFSFRTFPDPAMGSVVKIATGSCASVGKDQDQKIWDVVAGLNPTVMLWTGDNVYGDSPDLNVLRSKYPPQRNVRRLLPVNVGVQHIATWDDHDFGRNNSDYTFAEKVHGLRAFKEYWANPSYGEPDNPGVYFDIVIGGAHLFVLDGRYHRDPNDAPDVAGKTFLGKRQAAWLKEKLKESTSLSRGK